jgi:DNA/RNA-binding domain of Phe-tRNA-synthetase-like protein
MMAIMDQLPFDVSFELEGWSLFWADLELSSAPGQELVDLRIEVAQRARADRDLATLASDPTVAALRRLFRAAGCDPTRYRPASEALLRRILKGADLPAIHPLVDLNNCLSVELAVPCCVMAAGTLSPPLVLRSGRPGESYESLRGPFNLEAKPLLVDRDGPCDAPITGSERVKVKSETRRAWLVSYLPADVVTPQQAGQTLESLLQRAPVAEVRLAAGV